MSTRGRTHQKKVTRKTKVVQDNQTYPTIVSGTNYVKSYIYTTRISLTSTKDLRRERKKMAK